jgi:uncharacterized protein (TIGR03437 family)
MGIITRSIFICVVCCGIASAAPKLRLSTAAVGPVFVATGQNGPQQLVAVSNAGDGTLSVSALANVSWIVTFTATDSIRIALNTSSLARGLYTGIVTVSDPNAVDAPQTITVTVQIGSAIPDSMDLYLPAGGSATSNFTTGSPLTTTVNSPSGGPTLSVAGLGGGSFTFNYSYQVKSQARAGLGDGDYPGSFTVTGSTTPGDNKTVNATSHVTSLPIAAPSSRHCVIPSTVDFYSSACVVRSERVQFKIVQGAAKQTQYLALNNFGLGTLAISGVSGAPSWLSATAQGNLITLIADASGMNTGTYTSTINIASNARNSPTLVPVELDVLPAGPAWTYYQGVVDNAVYGAGDPLPQGGIIALFGEQLTAGPGAQAGELPLGTTLGGATVFVNNQPAPIYYVSPGQIDFMVPYGATPGDAVVRVDRDGQRGNSVSVRIAPTAPRLLPFGSTGYAIAVLSDLVTFAMPPIPGIPSRPAKGGTDVVVFYAIGLGQTSPPAVDGQAAAATEVNPRPKVVFGESLIPGTGITTDPFYAGLTPGFVGLYQINVTVPANTAKGDAVPTYLNQNGVLSNRVNIAIQ